MKIKAIEIRARKWFYMLTTTVAEYRAIVILISMIAAIALMILGRKSGIFEFPFNSAVWGETSDWFMFGVTLLTAIYLIKTFNEQKKFNRLSLEQIRIANLPIFTISKKIQVSPKPNCHYIKLILKKGVVFNFSPSTMSDFLEFDYSNIKFQLLQEDSIEFQCNVQKIPQSSAIFTTFLKYSFSDAVGNRYTQSAYIDQNQAFGLNPPVLIKNTNSLKSSMEQPQE